MKYCHGEEINEVKHFNKEIEKNGGIIPCFVQQIEYSKVEFYVLKKYLNAFKNPKFLHIGCGKGFVPIYLSYFYKNIEAMDIDKNVVDYANTMNKYLHGNTHIYQKDCFDLSETKHYDIIYCDSIFEYIPYEKRVDLLRKFYSLSDYLIIASVTYPPYPNVPYIFTKLKQWKKFIKKSGGKIVEIYGIQYPLKFMNIAAYIPSLAKSFHRYARVLFMVIKRKRN